jgi:hypothetical protein
LPAALASFLPLAGGTMSGVIDMGNNFIQNLTDPINPQDAATKAYADLAGGGFTVILAADYATTANLNATQAGAGVGATLTNAGVMAAFSVDGASPTINQRILVKNQTLTQHNGVYNLTTIGSAIANWVLTRATDYDQAAEIQPGTLIAVNGGTVNANTSWLETATVVVVDTDPVLFSQFTFAPSSFFLIANNLSEGVPATMRTNLGLTGAATMTLPVSAANGGTGIANSNTITLGGNVITAGAHTLAGAFASTFTFTGATSVTFPTSGTLITDAQPTINQPNIVGTTTNDNAATGSVGEFVSAQVLFAARLNITSTGVARNVTTISLTAGDWDVQGGVYFLGNGSASTAYHSWCSLTSATEPDLSLIAQVGISGGNVVNNALTTQPLRVSIAGTTTVYLSCLATFTAGTPQCCGFIRARRIR